MGVALVIITALAAAADPPPAVDTPTVAVRIVPADAAPTPAAKPQPMICRSSIETGSLIKRRKSCLTARQWEYVDQAHRDEARKIMMDNMGRPPGG